jgi:outer membrane protein
MKSRLRRFGFLFIFGSLITSSCFGVENPDNPKDSFPKNFSRDKLPADKVLTSQTVSGKSQKISETTLSEKTLKEAYLSAVARSETLAIQQELLTQTNEQESQATAGMLPTVNGTAGFLTQPSPNNPTGSAVSPPEQKTVKLTLTQPLFRGFRDFAALRQKKDLEGAQSFNIRNVARQLFYDVSQAYFNVRGAQSDKKGYEAEIEINQRRLKELQNFLKIGRSQITDLLTFQSNIASLEVSLESTIGQYESAKDVLAYLTGWNRDTVILLDEVLPSTPLGIDNYLSKIEARSDVQAAKLNVEANEENIPIARGAHLPSVDFVGNYYLTRPGALSTVNWDAQLALTLPIFQGGLVQSQLRQAESISHQYSLILSQTRRLAEQEIRTFYDAYSADLKQFEKLAELVDIATRNSEAEIKFYRNGLVTNLDVFQAISTHQTAQRQLDRSRQTLQLDAVKLQAATGERAEIDIKL